jgi:hypothetical protein
MKTIKKYDSFEALKLSETKRSDSSEIVRRHNEFEKAIKEISLFKSKKEASKRNQ